MKICFRTIIIVIFVASYTDYANAYGAEGWSKPYSKSIWETIKRDHKNFYSSERVIRIGIAFGIGGILANTNIDEKIQDEYQDNVRSSSTDDFAKIVKTFGEGTYLIPLSLFTATLPEIIPKSSATSIIGEWGRLTSRSYLVGGPPLLLLQRATGASRPGESDDGSRWKPFNDSNGVSGHAFIGAVPFLSAARMSSNRLLRYGLYVASTFTAWSRINDNDHYTSQAILGWYLAWEAVGAVSESNENDQKWKVSPLFLNDGVGIQICKQF
jgi:PAP2 superfamily